MIILTNKAKKKLSCQSCHRYADELFVVYMKKDREIIGMCQRCKKSKKGQWRFVTPKDGAVLEGFHEVQV